MVTATAYLHYDEYTAYAHGYPCSFTKHNVTSRTWRATSKYCSTRIPYYHSIQNTYWEYEPFYGKISTMNRYVNY